MCTYNTISSHTDHLEIQKKGFRKKSIDFCKFCYFFELQHCETLFYCMFWIVWHPAQTGHAEIKKIPNNTT